MEIPIYMHAFLLFILCYMFNVCVVRTKPCDGISNRSLWHAINYCSYNAVTDILLTGAIYHLIL